MLFFEHERRFVKDWDRAIFDDAILFDIAEKSQLPKDVLLKLLAAAKDKDIGIDA